MPFTLATWNINSVRLREALVVRLMAEEAPDILCLQECKSPVENIPLAQFQGLGYRYIVARGQKGYNGVAILSKLPIVDAGDKDFAQLGHARHVSARLENGVTIHNCYVPAGGDVPDRDENVKFGQKLDYLTEMRDHFRWERPDRAILVGDNGLRPRLIYIGAKTVIAPGDKVITSGDAEAFPPGLPVGRVARVQEGIIEIEPFVSRDKLEYVRIVDYGLRGILASPAPETTK